MNFLSGALGGGGGQGGGAGGGMGDMLGGIKGQVMNMGKQAIMRESFLSFYIFYKSRN